MSTPISAALARAPSLAVVGSGPAAFYTVLRALQKNPDLRVDMFERQCTPYGLTRFGVAPDHPEVKSCQERFADAAKTPNFRFYGNCEVGKDVKLADLAKNFDAVLLAYGANSERKLGIPGENDVPGVFSARHFVGWYNGEPEFKNLAVAEHLARAKRATIIGNGNVALDVARMLLRDPEELTKTDISSLAIEALRRSSVESVQIVGRRGVLHSAFTNKELREIMREPGTQMLPLDPATEYDVVPKSRVDKRKLEILKKPQNVPENSSSPGSKAWQLKFLRSPSRFVGGPDGLKGIEWTINKYAEDGEHVVPTSATEYEPTELAFTSIGYKSLPITGIEDIGAEFDSKRGVLVRNRAQVKAAFDNIFAAGWAATGPVGVIAATMVDSFSVADEILNYLSEVEQPKAGREALNFRNSNSRIVSWKDWEKLDAEELRRGAETGKVRSKFLSNEEVLNWLDNGEQKL